MEKHRHKGAERWHPVTRVHKESMTKRFHTIAVKGGILDAVKKVIKKVVNKVTSKPKVQDYGTPPKAIGTYEPIPDSKFNPKTAKNFIIVKLNHKLLDDMLQSMSKKKAIAVGVPCRKVN